MKKTNYRLLFIIIALALLTAGFLFFNDYSKTHEVEGAQYERREVAKDFSLPVISKSAYYSTEARLSLQTARTKPVLLHFWASWCTVCREEKPLLDAFWAKHKDADLLVLGLASFDSQDAMTQSKLIETPSFTVLLDEEGDVANLYKVAALPVSVLVDEKGFIVQKFVGALKSYDYVAIENYLEGRKSTTKNAL